MPFYTTKPQAKDVEAIYQLFAKTIKDAFQKEGIQEAYLGEIKAEIAKQIDLLYKALNQSNPSEFYLIARNEQHIVGTIAYGQVGQEIKKYYRGNLQNTVEIKSAYILPNFQRQGIGTLLFKSILKQLQMQQPRIEQICLDSGYTMAQQFWQCKLGKPILTVKNRWGEGEDYMIWCIAIKKLL